MEYIRKDEVIRLIHDVFNNLEVYGPEYGMLQEVNKLKTYEGIKKVDVEPLPCPDDCCYLTLNQEEQDEWTRHGVVTQHLCSKYMKVLYHDEEDNITNFPQLTRFDGCEEF